MLLFICVWAFKYCPGRNLFCKRRLFLLGSFIQVNRLTADDKLVQRALAGKNGEQVRDCMGYTVVKCGNFALIKECRTISNFLKVLAVGRRPFKNSDSN